MFLFDSPMPGGNSPPAANDEEYRSEWSWRDWRQAFGEELGDKFFDELTPVICSSVYNNYYGGIMRGVGLIKWKNGDKPVIMRGAWKNYIHSQPFIHSCKQVMERYARIHKPTVFDDYELDQLKRKIYDMYGQKMHKRYYWQRARGEHFASPQGIKYRHGEYLIPFRLCERSALIKGKYIRFKNSKSKALAKKLWDLHIEASILDL